MKHYIFFAILLSLSFFIVQPVSAQNNPPPKASDAARKVMMPVVYKVPGMKNVKVIQNLKYKLTDNADHAASSYVPPDLKKMDLYLPPNVKKGEKRPVVIFIHGAAKPEYMPKDWGIYTSWGRLVAASGFVGVTFTHQLSLANKSMENAAQDLSDAVSYVRANADKYNVDRDRICLVAFSAGGPMLTLPMRGDMPFVKCLVGFYAFMDVRQTDYQKFESSETLKLFSPVTYLEKDAGKLPPMFIARAGLDQVPTMNDSIDRFVSQALAKNVLLNFANHPNGVHSFDNQTDGERSREIVRAAIEFIKTHLAGN